MPSSHVGIEYTEYTSKKIDDVGKINHIRFPKNMIAVEHWPKNWLSNIERAN